MARKSIQKTSKAKFEQDKSFGEIGEREISNFLTYHKMIVIGPTSCLYSDNSYLFSDLIVQGKKGKQYKVEIKTDEYYDTGNLAIELSCNKRKSGIEKTKSDIWIYYFRNLNTDNVWIIKSDKLRELIKTGNFHVASGGDGDGSRLALLPKNQVREHFKVCSWNKLIEEKSKPNKIGFNLDIFNDKPKEPEIIPPKKSTPYYIEYSTKGKHPKSLPSPFDDDYYPFR